MSQGLIYHCCIAKLSFSNCLLNIQAYSYIQMLLAALISEIFLCNEWQECRGVRLLKVLKGISDGQVFIPKQAIYTITTLKAQESQQRGGHINNCKSCRRAMKCCLLDMLQLRYQPQQQLQLLQQIYERLCQSRIWKDMIKPLSLLNQWLLGGCGEKQSLSCVSIEDPTRSQWIDPNPQIILVKLNGSKGRRRHECGKESYMEVGELKRVESYGMHRTHV